MKNAVIAEGLTKAYHGKPALNEMSAAFPEGQVSGLLGPNGSGKSTFLKLLAGVSRPDSGSVTVLDRAPGWKTNAEIAYLPDRAKWYGKQTVKGAVAFADGVYPGFDRERALKLVNEMKLDPKACADSLSRGQQALLMLAICLCRNVKLVLLDEPFSGIDLISRERIIRGIIDSLTERQQTFIIGTQEIHEAESLFEYVAFLKDGSVMAEGDAEEMRARHGSIETNYRRLFE